MGFLFNIDKKILRKDTRVIETEVVNFYIVKNTYNILGGFIKFTSKCLRVDYNPSNIPIEKRYKIDMGVQAAGYAMLSNNSDLMTSIKDDYV